MSLGARGLAAALVVAAPIAGPGGAIGAAIGAAIGTPVAGPFAVQDGAAQAAAGPAPDGRDGAAAAPSRGGALSADDARTAHAKSLAWLVGAQNEDGSWGTGRIDSLLEHGFALESFYAWQMASSALADLALASAGDTPERRAALERGIAWLTTARLPKRGEDWDIDYAWTALYGFVACVELVQDPRFAGVEETAAALRRRGMEFYDLLVRLQSIDGGWGYYDDPPYPAGRPMWATSFSTACVIPALLRAHELGWEVDPAVAGRATEYVRRCIVPGGAYSYDLKPVPRFAGESINDIKGSLGRTQVCNWALHEAGLERITDDRLREGLEAFFQHHVFLDVARMRPIPHEAYYYNSGYFYFFGHYYAGLVIELLPEEEREAWHAKLRAEVVKAQNKDGSSDDFVAGGWSRVACTAFAALALREGL